jgi:methionyl-tRNA formyltransferase
MRVAFLGNDPWSVPSLRALRDADDVDLALVVTNPPRPAGRGSRLTPTAVAEAAHEGGLPLLEVEAVRSGDGFDVLAALEPDALVVVAYGEILTPDVLDLPVLGAVNLHFSLLPRWRGAAPVRRAILEGDELTGVTVMLMDEGMDTGPILSAIESPIDAEEDAGTLGARLAALGAPLLIEVLRGLAAGTVEPRPQDHAGATYAPKPKPEERTLDWTSPSDAIVRRVRAFAPEPGAATTFRALPLKILRAADRGQHGAVLTGDAEGASAITVLPNGDVAVAAGHGSSVGVLDVAPAGRKRMSGADWARGARIRPGERLG